MNKFKRPEVEDIFARWWERLMDSRGVPTPRPRRAELARLRRIGLIDTDTGPKPDFTGALAIDSFRELYRLIRPFMSGNTDYWDDDLVIAAVTLAHIQEKKGPLTAALLGGGDPATRVMQEARFRRLMRADTPGDLFDQARRITALLKKKAPVGELGISLLLWRHWPNVRRDWARAYYNLDGGGLENTETPPPAIAGIGDAP